MTILSATPSTSRSWPMLGAAGVLLLLLLMSACGTDGDQPVVTGVAPNEVARALGDRLVLDGRNLDTTREVVLVSGSQQVPLVDVSARPSQVVASVPPDAPTGLYSIRLRTGDGDTTLERALRIVDGELEVVVADVGQGDGGYIRTPGGHTLLIDGGRGRDRAGRDSVAPALATAGITEPDWVLTTHFDADHLGGVVQVLSGADGLPCTPDDVVPTRGVLDYAPGLNTCNSDLCLAYYQLRRCIADARGSQGWLVPAPGASIPLGGGARVTVLALNGQVDGGTTVATGSENSNSIALLLEYGRFRYLTAGDITGGPDDGCQAGADTADVETAVGRRAGPVDVLHVNHHGSCTSSNAAFLGSLQPQVALVSVGENNSYGHPHASVLGRLGSAVQSVFLTSGGITTPTATLERTRLPDNAERRFGHLRVSSRTGQEFSVQVLGSDGRLLTEKTYSTRAP